MAEVVLTEIIEDMDLDRDIKWLKDGRRIDFDMEPPFIQTNHNSLIITKTMEVDSGSYTYKAITVVDEHRMMEAESLSKDEELGKVRKELTEAIERQSSLIQEKHDFLKQQYWV